ncbi:MAG: guanylate kinase [Phycisphaerae bacterium]
MSSQAGTKQGSTGAAPAGQWRRGAVVIVSGPSGVGKSTVCARLCAALPAEFSVSYTTRGIRPGEVRDQSYRFVTRDEFARLRDAGRLLEWAEVYGHYYGTPAEPVERALAERRVIVLEIDIHGTQQVRQRHPELLAFFLLPPTPEEQRRRITARQANPQAEIAARLARADGEVGFARECGCYNQFIVNDSLEQTVQTITQAVVKELVE